MKSFITLASAGDNYTDTLDHRQETVFMRWKDEIKWHPNLRVAGVIVFVERDCGLMHNDAFYGLPAGSFFAASDDFSVSGGAGVLIQMAEYRPMFQIGGPLEWRGRLKYIDGCTDSLLIPPIKKGDPCFNALFFPPGIDQTEHTHPSIRVGLVVSGSGECVTPERVIPLTKGVAFIIETDGLHKFRTGPENGMVVVAYHPDSDFGPEDTFHPMINRTIVEGVSANALPGIQTK